MAIAGELAINLIGDISGLKKSFNKAKKQTKSLQGKIKKAGQGLKSFGGTMTKFVTGPIAGAGTAILGLAKKTGDYADSVLDAKSATGLTTETIQKYQEVAKQAGVSTDAYTKAAKNLTKQMSRGENGSARMRRALKEIGVTYEELQSKSPDEQMEILTQKLRNIEDSGKRAKVGTQLFSNSFEELAPILDMSQEKIDQVTKAAKENGSIMGKDALESANNFRQSLQELKQEFTGLMRSVASDLMPVLQEDLMPVIKNSVIPALRNLGKFLGNLMSWFSNLPGPVKQLAIQAGALAAALGPAAMGLGSVISALAGPISTLIGLLGGISGGGLIAALSPLLGPAGLIAGAIALFIAFDDEIMGFVRGALDKLYQAFVKLKNFLPKYVKSLKEDIISDWNTMIDFFKGLPDRMWNLGKNIIQGLIDGIKNMINKPIEMIKNLGSNILGEIKNTLGISSPSEEFMSIGENVVRGLNAGIENQMDNLKEKSLEMTAQIEGNFNGEGLQPNITGAGPGNNGPAIYIDKMEVRDEKDIDNLEERFKSLERRRNRRVQQ